MHLDRNGTFLQCASFVLTIPKSFQFKTKKEKANKTNKTIATMKLSIAVFFSALGFVHGSSLRAVSTTNNSESNHKTLNSQIVLGGTSGEPSQEDSDFLARALVASYNNVHWEVGHYMTGVDSAAFQASSSTSSGVFEIETPVLIWLWPGFLCRHCPDDDAMGAAQQSLLLQAVTEDCAGLCHEEATKELESNFCDRIQSGSSDYLKSADSCSITFHVNDENISSNDNDKPAAPETVATIGSTIILKGAGAGETTQEEKALLAKAFVSAYNDVHWDANHYLSDAEIPFVANSAIANENASINTLVLEVQTPVLIWLWPGFLCRHCPDDDAMGTNLVGADELSLDSEKKTAVEKLFLHKIQSSVSEKLAGTHSVSFAIDSVVASSETKTW